MWRFAVLLLLLGSAAATIDPFKISFANTNHQVDKDEGKVTLTGRTRQNNTLVFGNEAIVQQTLSATAKIMADIAQGKLQMTEAIPKDVPRKEVKVDCLNSKAPEPLNWKMWCPGKDAKIYDWIDKSGASHREWIMRPQKELTSTMVQWFAAWYVLGLGDPVVEFQGKNYYWYHLWHPLDHVEAGIKVKPNFNPFDKDLLTLDTLVFERYRNLKGSKSKRFYETDGWFTVVDPIGNAMKNRLQLKTTIMGVDAMSFLMEFKDTPDGLIIRGEMIVGVPPKGYDPYSPDDGNLMAATLNEVIIGQTYKAVKGSSDWSGLVDAMTRHMIEEFSNLQFFVPELYKKYSMLGGVTNYIPTLGTFLSKLNLTAADLPSVNYYEELKSFVEALPKVDLSALPVGNKIVSTVQAAAAVVDKGPISAMHYPATPEALKQPPEFAEVVKIRDQASEALQGVSMLIGLSMDSFDGSDDSRDPLSIQLLLTQAMDLAKLVQDGVDTLSTMIADASRQAVTDAATSAASQLAHEVQQEAYQLQLLEDTIQALTKTQAKYAAANSSGADGPIATVAKRDLGSPAPGFAAAASGTGKAKSSPTVSVYTKEDKPAASGSSGAAYSGKDNASKLGEQFKVAATQKQQKEQPQSSTLPTTTSTSSSSSSSKGSSKGGSVNVAVPVSLVTTTADFPNAEGGFIPYKPVPSSPAPTAAKKSPSSSSSSSSAPAPKPASAPAPASSPAPKPAAAPASSPAATAGKGVTPAAVFGGSILELPKLPSLPGLPSLLDSRASAGSSSSSSSKPAAGGKGQNDPRYPTTVGPVTIAWAKDAAGKPTVPVGFTLHG